LVAANPEGVAFRVSLSLCTVIWQCHRSVV